jgi:hypothetical protein
MARTGTTQGRRRRGRPLAYDPASGEPWKTTARFTPENAARLIALRDRIHPHLPIDDLLDCLTGLVPGPDDPPLTHKQVEVALHQRAAPYISNTQEELPLTG